MLLGLGGDGHTASLFPGSPLLQEREHLVGASYVEAVKGYRISLTLPVINHARRVVFLVAGDSKAEILHKVLNDDSATGKLPSQMVHPVNGSLTWILDRPAARLLKDQS